MSAALVLPAPALAAGVKTETGVGLAPVPLSLSGSPAGLSRAALPSAASFGPALPVALAASPAAVAAPAVAASPQPTAVPSAARAAFQNGVLPATLQNGTPAAATGILSGAARLDGARLGEVYDKGRAGSASVEAVAGTRGSGPARLGRAGAGVAAAASVAVSRTAFAGQPERLAPAQREDSGVPGWLAVPAVLLVVSAVVGIRRWLTRRAAPPAPPAPPPAPPAPVAAAEAPRRRLHPIEHRRAADPLARAGLSGLEEGLGRYAALLKDGSFEEYDAAKEAAVRRGKELSYKDALIRHQPGYALTLPGVPVSPARPTESVNAPLELRAWMLQGRTISDNGAHDGLYWLAVPVEDAAQAREVYHRIATLYERRHVPAPGENMRGDVLDGEFEEAATTVWDELQPVFARSGGRPLLRLYFHNGRAGDAEALRLLAVLVEKASLEALP